jgi:hypothetical protein
VKPLEAHAHVGGTLARIRIRLMKVLDELVEPSSSAAKFRKPERPASLENKSTLKEDLLITAACAALIITVLAWYVLK